jgi:hypothetical protein
VPVETVHAFPRSASALAQSINATLGSTEHRCIGSSRPAAYDFKTHCQYCTMD